VRGQQRRVATHTRRSRQSSEGLGKEKVKADRAKREARAAGGEGWQEMDEGAEVCGSEVRLR